MLRTLREKPSFRGWRFGIWLSVASAAVVLIVNLSVTIWALASSVTTDGDNRRELLRSSCPEVKRVNTAGHVVINALSTILLSASNYSMQCLASPSRKQVDGAHKKQRWVNIGTHSLRNFRLTARSALRFWLWFLLLMSSLPLHLFYNSALFSALVAVEYNILKANSDFLAPGRGNASSTSVSGQLYAMALAGRLERLENLDCITAYSEDFQGSRSNLVLIVDSNVTYSSEDPGEYNFRSGEAVVQASDSWLCADMRKQDQARSGQARSGYCAAYLPELKAKPSEWTVGGARVEYCLSQPTGRICRLYFSPTIAGAVIGMNAIKAVAMGLVLYVLKDTPLLNLGDAVASFLEAPDETTECMGVVSKGDFKTGMGYTTWVPGAKPYDTARQRRYRATGRPWICCFIFFYLILMALFLFFLYYGVNRFEGGPSWDKIWAYGIGSAAPQTLITGSGERFPLLALIVLANTPQVFLSVVYFWYNSILTSIAMAMEWEHFATVRKGLRVSSLRRGAQRGSHMLQLPYRLAIPLMIISGVLHWLASQSLYLADVDYVQSDPPVPYTKGSRVQEPGTHYSTCGYSPLAIICLVILGLVMIVVLLALSCTKFRTGMPVAGNCSAAISAACHGYAKPGSGASELPVRWGEVLVQGPDGKVRRRCAFSHEEVSEPVNGRVYPEEVDGIRRSSGSLMAESEARSSEEANLISGN